MSWSPVSSKWSRLFYGTPFGMTLTVATCRNRLKRDQHSTHIPPAHPLGDKPVAAAAAAASHSAVHPASLVNPRGEIPSLARNSLFNARVAGTRDQPGHAPRSDCTTPYTSPHPTIALPPCPPCVRVAGSHAWPFFRSDLPRMGPPLIVATRSRPPSPGAITQLLARIRATLTG